MEATAGVRYPVLARNPATESENRIHADEVARRYGFRGGLVPGVTVYGYVGHALLEALGPRWVEQGVTSIRFQSPCYDGEELLVSFEAGEFEVTAGERTCAVGSAYLPDEERGGLDVEAIPSAPAPLLEERPVASDDSVVTGQVLGSVRLATHPATTTAYLERLGEPAPIYSGAGLVHPALLLEGANRVLMANFMMPAWLHVASEVQHRRAVPTGEHLEVRGRIAEVFQRKGHRFVRLDVTWEAAAQTVAAARHTAIWQLAES